jgi:gluconate 2-dehydrogenase gamma chain
MKTNFDGTTAAGASADFTTAHGAGEAGRAGATSGRAGDLLSRREALRRAALFLGVALTPSLVSGVLQAATAAAPAPSPMGTAKASTVVSGNFKPAYLTGAQLATAGAVAERILPQTDTPGALAVGVPAFLDLMYGKYLPDEDRKQFVAGLAEVEALSAATHQRGFTALTVDQQDALLTTMARAAQGQPRSFFAQIKELTIVGYFTAEPVGKTVLNYDPVPGPYKGCVPLAEVGNKSWTK